MTPTTSTYLGLPGLGLFWFLTLSAICAMAYSLSRRFDLLATGAPENRFDRIFDRIRSVIDYALIQKRMFRDPYAGIFHIFLFWGFVVLGGRTIQLVVEGLLPGWTLALGPMRAPYELSKDLFELMVLVAVGMALARRAFARPARLDLTLDAWCILGMIGALMITDLSAEGASMALGVHPFNGATLPISSAAGALLLRSGLSSVGLDALYGVCWWTHLVVIYFFGNYLPYSKHFHIITAVPNIFFRNLGPIGALTPIDLEKTEKFGVTNIQDFSWKSMLDMYTCTECGRCREVCPTHLTGKPLIPKKYVDDLRDHLYENAPLLLKALQPGEECIQPGKPLIGGTITEDTIWACTTCRFCEQACPVHITFVDKIVEMRRHLVLEESSFPKEAQIAFRGMETNGNPWQIGQSARADWAKDLPVKSMAEAQGDGTEILFWVGCAGSYEDRAKKVSRALVELMNIAKIKFAILGTEETCTGDSARRMGNEYLFQTLCQTNVETLNGYGVKKIVTNCPHCFNTLANEYPQFGGNYDVVHGTELVAQLVAEGRIRLTEEIKQSITYHDACYLGRYNEIYDAPRQILQKIPGMEVREMTNNRDRGLCCGAGGGRMWMEEKIGQRINQRRLEDIVEMKTDSVAVACPFCMVMIGNAAAEMNQTVAPFDVLELAARSAGVGAKADGI